MDLWQTLNLAVERHLTGNLRDAETLYRQVLQVEPRNPDALHMLGVIAHQVGKNDLAVDYIQQALRLRPHFAQAYNNLGTALNVLGRITEAISSYQQALRLKPDYAEAYSNLGRALHDQGRLQEAMANYQQALRLKPDLAETHNNLGTAWHEQGKLEEAAASYAETLRLQPDFPAAQCNLGQVLQQQNDMVGSERVFREVLRVHPRHPEALWQLAIQLRGKLPEADRADLETRLAEPNLDEGDRAKLHFGLAHVYDARGEHEQAAVQLCQANALTLAQSQRKGQGYDVDRHTQFVEDLIEAYSPAYIERVRGFGLDTERPVFIIGFPRSGTTLTEQILAAHSQVFGAGELFLGRDGFLALGTQRTSQSTLAALPGLERETVRLRARWHLDQLGNLNHTATRVVDKMPENYIFLGLLATMFPRAKFIHCRRDLRDVAVSCWMTHFRQSPWSNDPKHIATRIREYLRLMEHWRAVLPVSLLEINYEETVADLPGVARRLAEWCGLDWEPACLAFHESKRPVGSASVTQVREPLYNRSVGRWRNYEGKMSELFAAINPLLSRGT